MASRAKRLAFVCLAALVALTACAPAEVRTTGAGGESESARPAVKKRINAAAMGALTTVSGLLAISGTGSNLPGTGEVERLLNAGLTSRGATQPLEPLLAEALPTTENGLWKVFPDGRMETTWQIRAGVRWHDGVPFSAHDLAFTAGVAADRDLAVRREAVYDQIEAIDVVDSRTLTVRWKRTYIEADTLFGEGSILPLPRHLLESAYQENKATFTSLAYWNREFIGTGPFRLREWADGSHALLDANDAYALGRPRIDQIEVKFIPSPPTLVANILAGTVELTLGRSLSLEQAAEVRGQWRDGAVQITGTNPNIATPQHRSPQPAIVGNVQFRRALWHALDREEMAAALTGGLAPVAHSGLPLGDPQYREAEAGVVRYEYDTRRAAQLIEGLGYTRGPGGMFADAGGRPLNVEIRGTEKDINVRTILAVADYWRRVGVATDTTVIPAALQADPEYYLTFSAFQTGGSFGSLGALENIRASEVPGPNNRFRGRNTGAYVNGELEELIDRYFTTIPLGERNRTLRSVFGHLTDQVVTMYLYYDANPTVVGNRIVGVSAGYFGNAHQWDVI